MKINKKMTYEELVAMRNSVADLPFYVTRKVGSELKVYAYSHSSMTNGYIRKNATYNPKPYKGNFWGRIYDKIQQFHEHSLFLYNLLYRSKAFRYLLCK